MNWDHVARMWKRAKGKIQEKWDKLTDDDLKIVEGRRDWLEDSIQHRYGFSPDHYPAPNLISQFRTGAVDSSALANAPNHRFLCEREVKCSLPRCENPSCAGAD